jgi:hypothetical protein
VNADQLSAELARRFEVLKRLRKAQFALDGVVFDEHYNRQDFPRTRKLPSTELARRLGIARSDLNRWMADVGIRTKPTRFDYQTLRAYDRGEMDVAERHLLRDPLNRVAAVYGDGRHPDGSGRWCIPVDSVDRYVWDRREIQRSVDAEVPTREVMETEFRAIRRALGAAV